MARPRFRLLPFAAFAAAGAFAAVLASAQGGCAFSNNGNPAGQVCSTMGTWLQQCGGSSACPTAFVNDCSKISTSISELAFNTLFYCAGEGASCGDASSPLLQPCLLSNYSTDPGGGAAPDPDPTRQKLEQDYCNACAPGNAQCVLFDVPTVDGGALDSGISLTSLALAGDNTLGEIDSKCIASLPTDADTVACEAAFTACANPIAAAGVYFPAACLGGSNDGG